MSERRMALSDRTLGTVAFLLALLGMLAVLTGEVGRVFSHDGNREIHVQFADTRQLTEGDPVRIDGIDVGKVDDLRLDAGGRATTATLRLKGDAGPLFRDASAQIRFRSLLGGAFFVELRRGTPSSGQLLGGRIGLARAGSQVELDDVASILRGRVEKGMRTMPEELAKAVRDPGTPARAFATIAAQAPSLRRGLAAVRGQAPDTDLRTLVASTARTARALDAPGGHLRQVVAGAATLVQTTAGRRAEIQDVLRRAPGVMGRTNLTLSGLDETLRIADPLLSKLLVAAPAVAPTVARLRGAVVPADRLLQRAVPLLHDLRPAVRSLAAAARRGLPLIDGLEPSLKRLDSSVLPYMAKDDPGTHHSMAEMIGPATAALSAIGAYVDNGGRAVRFPATSGNNAFYLPCQSYLNNPDKTHILACEALKDAATTAFTLKPVPEGHR